MAKIKLDIPHSLAPDEAQKRVEALFGYWGRKYGVKSNWAGEVATFAGKVMRISFDGQLSVLRGRSLAKRPIPAFCCAARPRSTSNESSPITSTQRRHWPIWPAMNDSGDFGSRAAQRSTPHQSVTRATAGCPIPLRRPPVPDRCCASTPWRCPEGIGIAGQRWRPPAP